MALQVLYTTTTTTTTDLTPVVTQRVLIQEIILLYRI